MKRGIPASRMFFLPNVVDTERFKPAAKALQGPITLLTVGRLTREKRFDRFISLLHQLRIFLGLDVRGWIVGPTRADQDLRPELEHQAAGPGLRSTCSVSSGAFQKCLLSISRAPFVSHVGV